MQRETNIKHLWDVKSTGRHDTKRVRRKSPRAVNRGKKSDCCAKAQWRETLWRPRLLVRPSRGQREFKRNSQICLSYRWDFVSCGNRGTNRNWACYFVDACTYPCWSWCLHVGVILPRCLVKKTWQLPTHETWTHRGFAGYHTVTQCLLWDDTCRFNSSPHLKRRASDPPLVLAVLLPLLNSCQAQLLIRCSVSHFKLLKLQEKTAAHKKRVESFPALLMS